MVKQFSEDRDWDQFHNAKELAIGIATEASELLEQFRFKTNGEADRVFESASTRQAACDEMADTMFFLLRLAQRYDIDLTTELRRKIQTNARRYPAEKAKGSNKKYTEL